MNCITQRLKSYHPITLGNYGLYYLNLEINGHEQRRPHCERNLDYSWKTLDHCDFFIFSEFRQTYLERSTDVGDYRAGS